MAHITNMDLQNLRHIIGNEQLCCEKAMVFSQQVEDPQLRSYLERKVQSAQQNVQTLNQFLMS